MRKILMSQVQPGMSLGKNVFSPNGHILLAKGAVLTSGYLMRMQALGFSALIIQEDFCGDIEFSEIISERYRVDGMITLRNVFEEAKKSRNINTGAIKSLVNGLTDEVIQNRRILFEVTDIRPYDSYLYGHCINVCIMALRVGLMLGYNEFQLRDLGVGAILHDIGTVFIDKQVSEKAGILTSAEFEKMKKHSTDGFNLLREQKDINLLSAHVAFQHHERIDGSGYPRALNGTEICEYAKIVSIADEFDALTSERKHRKAYPNHVALSLIEQNTGNKIDSGIFNYFLKNISIYPTGSLVEINSGEVGLVISNNSQNIASPVIRILTNSSKQVHPNRYFRDIDLIKNSEVFITRVITNEEELAEDIKKQCDEITGKTMGKAVVDSVV